MIIICPQCSTRLQVDDAKAPTRPFVIRCPKCNSSVDSESQSPALEQSALAVGNSPATANSKFDLPTPAPLFQIEEKEPSTTNSLSATDRLAELLTALVSQQTVKAQGSASARPLGDARKALVCVAGQDREAVARGLAENGYQVFVAQDTRQAIDRMRENQLDVVLLDPKFDQAEQGAVYITREVNILRPAQRRRLFFVLLTPALRSMDAHAAFLNNVNAVLNLKDVAELPQLMERRIREYNELYKEFNTVLGMPAL
ncbi:MAG: hypothetical protein QOJ88_251 [Pyrinomonadaceae bacterium]|nr:hypothetical protein [Pyrinomonadaceae bacterium]MDQ1728717.1 hypothetical protein [Pyrinomonadaceae bacterium]